MMRKEMFASARIVVEDAGHQQRRTYRLSDCCQTDFNHFIDQMTINDPEAKRDACSRRGVIWTIVPRGGSGQLEAMMGMVLVTFHDVGWVSLLRYDLEGPLSGLIF
jgi:hypothetical protein